MAPGADARRCLQSQLAAGDSDPRNWQVRPVDLLDGHKPCFARIYRPTAWHKAARNLAGRKRLTECDIEIPRLLGSGFVSLPRGKVFAILEEKVDGVPLSEIVPDGTQAYDYGRALARLHATPSVVALRRSWFETSADARHLYHVANDSGAGADLIDAMKSDLALARDKALVGPFGVTHGGIKPENLLYDEDRGLYWIDLDDVGVLPLRFSLAAAEIRIFKHDPELIGAFAAAYFEGSPRDAESWAAARVRWYRLYLARQICYLAGFVRNGEKTVDGWHRQLRTYRPLSRLKTDTTLEDVESEIATTLT